jgi:hypothetical protein
MHRHFSNRGEAQAELTAARMLAGRKQSAKSAITQDGRRGTAEQWFSQPVEATPRPKRKKPKRSGDVTTLL